MGRDDVVRYVMRQLGISEEEATRFVAVAEGLQQESGLQSVAAVLRDHQAAQNHARDDGLGHHVQGESPVKKCARELTDFERRVYNPALAWIRDHPPRNAGEHEVLSNISANVEIFREYLYRRAVAEEEAKPTKKK